MDCSCRRQPAYPTGERPAKAERTVGDRRWNEALPCEGSLRHRHRHSTTRRQTKRLANINQLPTLLPYILNQGKIISLSKIFFWFLIATGVLTTNQVVTLTHQQQVSLFKYYLPMENIVITHPVCPDLLTCDFFYGIPEIQTILTGQ